MKRLILSRESSTSPAGVLMLLPWSCAPLNQSCPVGKYSVSRYPGEPTRLGRLSDASRSRILNVSPCKLIVVSLVTLTPHRAQRQSATEDRTIAAPLATFE